MLFKSIFEGNYALVIGLEYLKTPFTTFRACSYF